jgi:IS4 transposase
VEYTVTVVPEHGQTRTESYRLITTLLDPARAPAGQVARTYAERWESETGYADLKTYLRGPRKVLRSKDPNGVAQELYACSSFTSWCSSPGSGPPGCGPAGSR